MTSGDGDVAPVWRRDRRSRRLGDRTVGPVVLRLGVRIHVAGVGPGGGIDLGEQQVEPAPGLVEDPGRLPNLGGRADLRDLGDRAREAATRGAEVGEPVVGARLDLRPHRVELGGVLLGERPARLGQVHDRAAGLLLGVDQALVGQLGDGRVDRSRAGLPRAAGALGDLLDDLVAVAGLLAQEREDREPDVATGATPRSATTMTTTAGAASATPRSATTTARATGPPGARARILAGHLDGVEALRSLTLRAASPAPSAPAGTRGAERATEGRPEVHPAERATPPAGTATRPTGLAAVLMRPTRAVSVVLRPLGAVASASAPRTWSRRSTSAACRSP